MTTKEQNIKRGIVVIFFSWCQNIVPIRNMLLFFFLYFLYFQKKRKMNTSCSILNSCLLCLENKMCGFCSINQDQQNTDFCFTQGQGDDPLNCSVILVNLTECTTSQSVWFLYGAMLTVLFIAFLVCLCASWISKSCCWKPRHETDHLDPNFYNLQ